MPPYSSTFTSPVRSLSKHILPQFSISLIFYCSTVPSSKPEYFQNFVPPNFNSPAILYSHNSASPRLHTLVSYTPSPRD